MSSASITYPAAIAKVSNAPVEIKDGMGETSCPSCGGRLLFRDGSGVCMESHPCGFRRGGPVDFMATVLGGFGKAVESAFGSLDDDSKRELSAEFYEDRKLTEFILALHGRQEDGQLERMNQRLIAKNSQFLDDEMNPAGILCTSAEETGVLFELLSSRGITCPPHMVGPCIVIPFWDTPHSVAMLYVHTTKGKRSAKLEVKKSIWSWTGLHLHHPTPGVVKIHPSIRGLLDAEYKDRGEPGRVSRNVMAYIQPSGADGSWEEKEMIFAGEIHQWYRCMPKWSYIDGFERSKFSIGGALHDLPGALHRMVVFSSQETEDRNRLLAMLSGMRVSEELGATLLDKVFRQFDPSWRHKAEVVLSRRLLSSTNRTRLYSTSTGYMLEDGETSTRISNFTLNLKDVVGLESSRDLMIRGSVVVGSASFPVGIPSSCLESGKAMTDFLSTRQILQGGDTAKEELATVWDNPGFKKVCNHLKRQVSKLPRVLGSRYLGWTARQDEFRTPGFTVREGTITEAVYLPSEDSSFHAFAPVAVPGINLRQPDNEILRGIVAALLANSLRAMLDLPFRLEPVRNDPEGRQAMQCFFAELGQTAPARVTSILPKHLSVVRGYPVNVLGLSEQNYSKVAINGVYLGERGMRMAGTSDQEAKEAGQMLLRMLTELAAQMTSGINVPYPERRSVALEGKAGIEGADLITQVFGIEWEVATNRYRRVDLLLEERKELLDEAARAANTTSITITHDIVEGVAAADDLALEFGLLCKEVELDEKGIRLDSISYSQLYERFYGDPPPIPAPDFRL